MKAVIALTIIVSLGCVTASPTFGAIAASKSSSSASASYSSRSSSASSFNYYSSDVCTAVGFTIRDDLATTIFDELEQQFLQKKCELLNSYGVYPRDIGILFNELQPDSLCYDIILIGSGPSGLSALPTLAALGKKILVVDKGYFPCAAADSLYYRSTLYNSEYVNAYPGYINGVDITKNLYTSNVFGGLSVLDTNAWNVGSRYLYDELSKINDEFTWEKIYGYYQGLESYKSYSRSVSVSTSTSTSSSSSSSSSGASLSGSSVSSSSSSSQTTSTTTTYEYSTSGTYSIYNSFKDTYLTKTLSSVFDELGYCNSASPFDLLPNKYSILPILGDRDRPTLFPYTVFNSLEQYKNNIDLALRTTANQIIFEGKRATGIKVLTPSGQEIVLHANDQVILGTGPLSTYQLLFNSGCGPEDLLTKYNIPINFPIPSLGNGLILPPVYNGLCLKFPKGYLINDYDSDLRNLAYAFGDYEISPTLQLNYYRAYLAVQGASEANVALKFHAFSQSTSLRLKSMMASYFQYDSYTQEYINSLISEYDILIVGTQLLAPRSRGLISYKDCIDQPYIDLGMFTDNYDVECMLEAIEQVKILAQTQTFQNLNCEIVQFPLQNFNGDFFTPDFNRQSILSHTIPSLYASGGFPIGLDYQTAVVDKALRVVGTDNLRLFSPCVSPYSLYSDSIAFSTFIGSYGAQVISNEYNGIFLDSIPISGPNSAISTSSSSYSSRDVDINSSSSSYSGTNINGVSGLDSSVYSSSSTSSEYEANQSSSSTVVGGNGLLSQQSSSSSTSSEYEANQSSSSTVLGGNGVLSQQSSSSSTSSEYEANQSSSSSVLGGNGLLSQQTSSSSSNSSYEADQSSSSTVLGANGLVSQQSSSSYDAEKSASNVSSSSYSSGLGGVQASSYEANSQSSSVSAEQQSSYVASSGAIAC